MEWKGTRDESVTDTGGKTDPPGESAVDPGASEEWVVEITPPELTPAPLPLPQAGAQEAMRQGDGPTRTTQKPKGDLHNIWFEVVPGHCGDNIRVHATVKNTGSVSFPYTAFLRLFTVLEVDERQGETKLCYDTVRAKRTQGPRRLKPEESTVVTFNPATPEVQPFNLRVELWGFAAMRDPVRGDELLDWEERTFSFPAPNLQLVRGTILFHGDDRGPGAVKYVGVVLTNSGQRATKGRYSVSLRVGRKGQSGQLAWTWSNGSTYALQPGDETVLQQPTKERPAGFSVPDIGFQHGGDPDWTHMYLKIHNECDEDFDQRDNHKFGASLGRKVPDQKRDQ